MLGYTRVTMVKTKKKKSLSLIFLKITEVQIVF
jgi:hypothetical protein